MFIDLNPRFLFVYFENELFYDREKSYLHVPWFDVFTFVFSNLQAQL